MAAAPLDSQGRVITTSMPSMSNSSSQGALSSSCSSASSSSSMSSDANLKGLFVATVVEPIFQYLHEWETAYAFLQWGESQSSENVADEAYKPLAEWCTQAFPKGMRWKPFVERHLPNPLHHCSVARTTVSYYDEDVSCYSAISQGNHIYWMNGRSMLARLTYTNHQWSIDDNQWLRTATHIRRTHDDRLEYVGSAKRVCRLLTVGGRIVDDIRWIGTTAYIRCTHDRLEYVEGSNPVLSVVVADADDACDLTCHEPSKTLIRFDYSTITFFNFVTGRELKKHLLKEKDYASAKLKFFDISGPFCVLKASTRTEPPKPRIYIWDITQEQPQSVVLDMSEEMRCCLRTSSRQLFCADDKRLVRLDLETRETHTQPFDFARRQFCFPSAICVEGQTVLILEDPTLGFHVFDANTLKYCTSFPFVHLPHLRPPTWDWRPPMGFNGITCVNFPRFQVHMQEVYTGGEKLGRTRKSAIIEYDTFISNEKSKEPEVKREARSLTSASTSVASATPAVVIAQQPLQTAAAAVRQIIHS